MKKILIILFALTTIVALQAQDLRKQDVNMPKEEERMLPELYASMLKILIDGQDDNTEVTTLDHQSIGEKCSKLHTILESEVPSQSGEKSHNPTITWTFLQEKGVVENFSQPQGIVKKRKPGRTYCNYCKKSILTYHFDRHRNSAAHKKNISVDQQQIDSGQETIVID